MTATNHALTGALIGLTVHQPALALPLAFASHFLLDAIPHYDSPGRAERPGFVRYLVVDLSLCFLLVLALVVMRPDGWLIASVCAFLATSPDVMWLTEFLATRGGHKPVKPTYALARFHAWVQWFQRPIGAVVEVFWATGAMVLLAKLI